MTFKLLIQVLSAFTLGGGLITFLSLLAERSNEKLAGIIMMTPTTIVLGYFFLGITTSPEKVAQVIPATLIPLGFVVFSSVVYIYCASAFSKFIKSKIAQIILTLTTSSFIWLVLVSPFAVWKFDRLSIGIAGYLCIVAVSHLILNRPCKNNIVNQPIYNRKQIVLRILFVGSTISTVVLLSKLLNPFWGGIFTVYPAATFATLIIFHFNYQPDQLFFFMRRVPLGSFSLLVYSLLAMILFPAIGVIGGTLASYCCALAVSLMLARYQKLAVRPKSH